MSPVHHCQLAAHELILERVVSTFDDLAEDAGCGGHDCDCVVWNRNFYGFGEVEVTDVGRA